MEREALRLELVKLTLRRDRSMDAAIEDAKILERYITMAQGVEAKRKEVGNPKGPTDK